MPGGPQPVRNWTVFRHEDVVQILEDHVTYSNAVSHHVSVPNGMDPPEHTTYRQIVDRYYTPERIAAFEPACREITRSLFAGTTAIEPAEGARAVRAQYPGSGFSSLPLQIR